MSVQSSWLQDRIQHSHFSMTVLSYTEQALSMLENEGSYRASASQ